MLARDPYQWRKKEDQTDPVLMEGEAISRLYFPPGSLAGP
jgi:hypothetical protein